MKRILVLTVVPLLVFALEKVNLIKDGGFEKNSDVWLMRSEAEGIYDSTVINRHNPDSAYVGNHCGSVDTRKQPNPSLPGLYYELGIIYQVLAFPKKISDLDSITISHMSVFRYEGMKTSAYSYGIWLRCTRVSDNVPIDVVYSWRAPDLLPSGDTPTRKLFSDTIPSEGLWSNFLCDLQKDLITTKGLSPDEELDSFLLYGNSLYLDGFWRGQKAFFDAIRLTGYADYDVGVKEILSGDSVWAGVDYKPVARIKSFGRQAADDFLAIAEIRQGEDLVWADTIPYTLPADTEDTLEFDSFPIPNALDYTLTVRTVMSPDESDEDDAMSKVLYGTAIAEKPISQPVTLDVKSFASTPRISYSLPSSQQGSISIYDASGRKVESLKVQGSGEVKFSPLSSGVYFVKLEAGSSAITRKAVIK